jgi:acetyl-CoA carboxylase biotin carboxylase subunit
MTRTMIHTLLIANRGEIAQRVIRACRRLGIRTAAVYSEADRALPYLAEVDRAICIGPAPAEQSYLDQEKILEAARRAGADAIHPGYGFLSENAVFAQRVRDAGLIFVGPHPEAIAQMGSKARAKAIAAASGVPVIPGYHGADQSIGRLRQEAEAIGYPVLIKAAAGGGGKGMRRVDDPRDIDQAIAAARREARAAFDDEELIVEKYFPSARHIEIQVFGDHRGNVVYFPERECSIQRRYQKIVEESPSPVLRPEERRRMGECAVALARAIGYDNAGTVEFIYTAPDSFYFLEVNTRLQVEHPITEEITGIDLVEWQIRVAEGAPLPLSQADIRFAGHALECRLYAEDARGGFLPVAGTVLRWRPPELEGLRYEAAIADGMEISTYYDPMIAKIVARGDNRDEALRRMRLALDRLVCLGLSANLPFLSRLMRDEAFQTGQYDTRFVETRMNLDDLYDYPEATYHHAAIGAALWRWRRRRPATTLLRALPPGWRNNYYAPQRERFRIVERDCELTYRALDERHFEMTFDGAVHTVYWLDDDENSLHFEVDGLRLRLAVAAREDWLFVHLPGTGQLIVQVLPRFPEPERERVNGAYAAPMPGEIVKVLVAPGQRVVAGENLLILTSMKMENTLSAAEAGEIEAVFVTQGQRVEAGAPLLKIKPDQSARNLEFQALDPY